MTKYDVVVVGAGSGTMIAEAALEHGLSVALIHKPPYGGTCQNFGCIPSKMLIFPADRILEIKEAAKLGIVAQIKSVDFKAIMERMRTERRETQEHERESLKGIDHFQYYPGEGSFVGEYTLEVNGEKITGSKIFLCNGARPFIPAIKGIESVGYLTNETVLELREAPESMIIIGGGYIGIEYGHFFSAMGTKVTILERSERLLSNEEPEISAFLQEEMAARMTVVTNFMVTEASKSEGLILVKGKDERSQEERTFSAASVFLASGRKSNADTLHLEKAGVAVDDHGFVKINEFLETSKKNIWAIGDVTGKGMFKHVANREADIAWHNAVHDHKAKMDFHAIPHAVFSYPQIASVGMTEAEAKKGHDLLVGTGYYTQTAWGIAMMEDRSFAKAVVDRATGRILGFHIVGPHASMLIQEVIDAMTTADGSFALLFQGLHIHPALSEVVLVALHNLKEVS